MFSEVCLEHVQVAGVIFLIGGDSEMPAAQHLLVIQGRSFFPFFFHMRCQMFETKKANLN